MNCVFDSVRIRISRSLIFDQNVTKWIKDEHSVLMRSFALTKFLRNIVGTESGKYTLRFYFMKSFCEEKIEAY